MEVAIITLLIVGLVLLLLEIVLPGMIAGSVGILCLLVAVILTYVHIGVKAGTGVLLGVVAALVVGMIVWMRYFPDSRIAKRFISSTAVGGLGSEQPKLLGQTGKTLTPLRPSGTAIIDGQRVDVVSEGPFLAAGTQVKVVTVEGLRVVVRAA